MALYKFKVSDEAGTISEMLIDGSSQTDASRRLQHRGLKPLQFLGEGSNVAEKRHGFRRKFDVVDFTDRLVPLLEAQIPLERALSIIGDGDDKDSLTEIAQDLRRGLHEGRKLSELIRERGRMFPQLYSGIVEAGEESGALPQVMGELRNFLLESQEMRSFIISSSIYPAFIATVGIIMLALVLGIIVPRFASSLAGAGIQSTSVDILLSISYFFQNYWWTFGLLVAAVAVIISQARRESGWVRETCDRLLLKLPIISQMVQYSNVSRLCRTMAILMRSGVHLLNTVAIANRVVQNHEIRQSLEEVSGELRQGQKISVALGKSKYLPPIMLKMITVGEETGGVESMLERVADRYETSMRKMVKRLLNLFEPLVIICLGLGVMIVVVLMFLAIMDMQGGV